ncbi:hypothetical protein HNQ51_002087 [Inhella inkyongensis]|uniref:Calcineurin-like phosphoesterase domain-containing protein n=1 Tax=Inhella inkyongensis TaxID=392593 RepID=A0A840S4Z5_9BURK|nr:metallophosphoesterase [Inhella inkyongensis]MBB5204773.1 hypothetical protein [Inhella inkyongensis]
MPNRRAMALWGLVLGSSLAWAAWAQGRPVEGAEEPRGRPREGPAHQMVSLGAAPALDLVLGRPGPDRVLLSLFAREALSGLQLWRAEGEAPLRAEGVALALAAGEVKPLTLSGLKPNQRYRVELRRGGQTLATAQWHTARPAGQAFAFTISADSHLDQNTDAAQYQRSLAAVRALGPDFHIDLGDTFMVDKHSDRAAAEQQYLAQRQAFSQLGLPLFLVLGNHDGEDRKLLKQGADSLGLWAHQRRQHYFPNPEPDGFYSGIAQPDPLTGAPLRDHYAWTWGDALFVVLNPYWHAPPQAPGGGRGRRAEERWQLSLGEAQYRWLRQTLEGSRARHKFVFVHQLIGGRDRQGRGGVEAAGFGEWGGLNADGSPGLAQQRPGWPEALHPLFVRTGVTAVFKGHDHLYALQRRDGIVYQTVPQPGHGEGGPDPADYGYTEGLLRNSGGLLRVSVRPDGLDLDYLGTGSPGAPRLLHRETLSTPERRP